MAQSDNLSSAKKAARTKIQVYDRKVRASLLELVSDPKRKSIRIADVCAYAGVSSDPLYEPHHQNLRHYLLSQLTSWEDSKAKRRRRHATPTETDIKLQKLMDDKVELERKLNNAQRALNVLGQMLENALSDRPVPSIVPIHRPRNR